MHWWSITDAAPHARPKARSRAGGCSYLGAENNDLFNAPTSVLAKVIKGAMGSAAGAGVAAIHMSAEGATPTRQCLGGVGWAQSPTRIRAGNATAKGSTNNTIKPKRSKTFGRQPWWLKGREEQKHFGAVWGAGVCNLADYPTKHHFPIHHKGVRPVYLHGGERPPESIKGCESISGPLGPAEEALGTIKEHGCLLAAAAA